MIHIVTVRRKHRINKAEKVYRMVVGNLEEYTQSLNWLNHSPTEKWDYKIIGVQIVHPDFRFELK